MASITGASNSVSNSNLGLTSYSSGIDFGVLIDAIVARSSLPLQQLQSQRSTIQARVDALRELNSRLIKLTDAVRALSDETLSATRAATSSNTSGATVTASDGATPATINLTVTRLATAFAQASRSFSSPNDPVLAAGATTATFELRKGGASSGPTITIDTTNNSLAGLRDAINAANAGVTATIVDTSGNGTEYQLVLTSTETGASNRVELVETSGTGTDANLNLRTLNSLGSPADYSQLDAEVSINGLVVHRATNKISDLVAGVTFELKATGTTTVSVANDTQAVANKIKAFVDAYNSVQDFILSQQNDPSGKAGGPLAADATLRAVQRNLRDALSASAVNDGGAFTNLTEIGIGRDDQGKLTLDQAKLDDRLRNAFSDTIALLAGKTSSNVGLADQILTVSSSMSDQISGSVQSAIKGYTDSVSRLDKLIADQQARLDALRQSLTRQFAAVDAAISQLNGQGTALSNIIKSLQPQSNNK